MAPKEAIMGKIVSNFFISLDGVVESPNKWHFPYFNDEMGAAIGSGSESFDTFLMGRVLYDEWSSYWPNQSDEVPFASYINNVRKYVVSNSLQEANWNNSTIVSGDVAGQLQRIKDETQRDIGMSGSPTLVRWLITHGLLDELRLMLHPIVVGQGHRLFEDSSTHPLRLAQHEVFETGVLNLTYELAS
jgi:dihydrofolate reductase